MHLAVLALLLSTAQAGDLEITADRPVRFRVDDRPARRRVGDPQTWVVGLSDGEHRVEARDLLGRTVDQLVVTLEGEERVVLRYEGRRLVEVGRGRSLAVERVARAMTEAAARATEAAATAAEANARAAEAEARAAEAHAAAAQAASIAAEVQATLLLPGIGEAETGLVFGLAPPAPGTLQSAGNLSAGSGGEDRASASFAGIDPLRFAVSLDGKDLEWVPHLSAFVATDLAPGAMPFVLRLDGQTALSAGFSTRSGAHTACTILVRPDRYDTGCTTGGIPLTAADLLERRPDAPVALPQPALPSMPERLLQVLIDSVATAPYERDKVAVLGAAAERHLFSCAQVVRAIEPIRYNAERLQAVQALRPAIVDPENHFLIVDAFPYNAEKEAVKDLFLQPPGEGEETAPDEAP